MRPVKTVACSLLLALGLASAASAASTWVHWEGQHFGIFIPNAKWQVVEQPKGVDISSPIGDQIVSFVTAQQPSPWTLVQVRNLVFTDAGMKSIRYVKVGRPYAVGSTSRQQDFEFTTRWRGGTWHGILTSGVTSTGFTYGIHAYLRIAHTARWKGALPTLTYIRNHITFYG